MLPGTGHATRDGPFYQEWVMLHGTGHATRDEPCYQGRERDARDRRHLPYFALGRNIGTVRIFI